MNHDASPHYFLAPWVHQTDAVLRCDLCVYGATAAGVVAARQAAKLGLGVVLLQPGLHIGGMTTGGLGCTDYGHQSVIGGAARQFYRDVGSVYGIEKEEWHFAPSGAQAVIDRYARESGVDLRLAQYLQSVHVEAGVIRSVHLLGGLRVNARVFIDATYEGDLLAQAGVRYTVGREANSVYGETINGVQKRDTHQFSHPVDPYVIAGNPASGLLPNINERNASPDGSGDHRIQAYNFRMCMTNDPALRVAWKKPLRFDPLQFELARRWFTGEKDSYNDQLPNYPQGPQDLLKKFDLMTHRTPGGFYKTDTNNHGPVSSDFIGGNYDWPEAGYAHREQIFQRHFDYQMGLYWFMANEPTIPDRYRNVYASVGLPSDEFTQTGHWPHQLYVREARRMISDYVLTEHDTQLRRQPEDSVGMGSYNMDSHNCQRFVRDGRVLNEGDVQLAPAGPYQVSYRSIVPSPKDCRNLLVPVCLSASHIAYGSVRMEPVFMVLAESAAIAASVAIRNGQDVQSVAYKDLRPLLELARQVI